MSLDLDDDGWLSFEKVTPYSADSAPGDLVLSVNYTDDKIVWGDVTRIAAFSDEWCEAYVNDHFPDRDVELQYAHCG